METEVEIEPQIEVTVSDAEAEDICHIMADITKDGEDSLSDTETEM